MKERLLRLSILLPSLFLAIPTLASNDRPNVVFILADDLGWSDTTLYGTTQYYKTPNIQRLADRGMLFTRAYSASPLCSPTRASILTGLSPARHGITAPQCHQPQVLLSAVKGIQAPPSKKSIGPSSATRLRTEHFTLAEALQQAGYATGHFGKWHLGKEPYSPLQHGFDIDVPHWPGPGPAGSYVAPWKFPDFDHDPDIPNEHIEDRMAKEAVSFMKEHRNEPFFLNYWMFSVHAPFDAKPDLIEDYRSRVNRSDEQRCPTYAAMIESMDDAVGTLLDCLDSLDLAENTIIIFASDNGGNMYNVVEGESPTSNRPLRGGKATMYEGGVRGPCVIAWPNHIPAKSRCDEVIQSMDFYPTLLDMTDITSRSDQRFDGVSLAPLFRGESLKRDAILTYFPHEPRVPDWIPPSASVHRGDWKLIRIFFGGDDGRHRWKLYNIKEDIGEKNDLSSQHRDLVKELDSYIEKHLSECSAVTPIANPDFDPSKYRIEMEGVPTRQVAGNKPKPNPTTRGTTVASWRPNHQASLKVAKGVLNIRSSGGDPHISHVLESPIPTGKLQVTVTMSSSVSSNAQFFWQEEGVRPAFSRDRSVRFETVAGKNLRQYEIEVAPRNRVTAIRLDPATQAGEIQLHSLIVRDGDGQLRFQWKLPDAAAKNK